MIEPAPHRPRCYRCMRPQRLCLCGGLPSVITKTAMVILQHPHERKHPFGTARLVGLCLPEARVHVAYGGLAGDLHCPLDLPADTALLYPHADAKDLAEVAASDPPSTLLVLDGTWSHARKLYVQNPWLRGLRHVRFHPRAPSRYRIRREPQPDYVSTLEAIVEALQILEPDTAGLPALGAAFDRMIDRQIEQIGSVRHHGRRKHERPRASRRLPPLLDEPDLLIAYAESSVPGGDVTASRELVQWVAARVESGETFECVIRPAAAGPSPYHLAHMGIAPETLAGGVSLAQARELFAQWAGPAPVAAWTKTSLDWGRCVMAPGTPECVLKTAYSNLRNHGAGVIEEVMRREGLEWVPNDCRGRARERLGNGLAVARWLRSMRGARLAVEAAAGTPSCSS